MDEGRVVIPTDKVCRLYVAEDIDDPMTLPNKKYRLLDEIYEWLKDAGVTEEDLYWNTSFVDQTQTIFWFENEEVAALFKLTWGGE